MDLNWLAVRNHNLSCMGFGYMAWGGLLEGVKRLVKSGRGIQREAMESSLRLEGLIENCCI